MIDFSYEEWDELLNLKNFTSSYCRKNAVMHQTELLKILSFYRSERKRLKEVENLAEKFNRINEEIKFVDGAIKLALSKLQGKQ